MSDTNTEGSITIPSDDALRQALRHAVGEVYRTGNLGELTVKRIRAAAEKDLDLPAGFFKADFRWKGESDRVIKQETEAQEAAMTTSPATKPKPKPKPKPSLSKHAEPQTSKKRTRPAPQGDAAQRRKRQKTSTPSTSESDESALSSLPEDLEQDSTEEQSYTRPKKPGRRVSKTEKTKSPSKTPKKEPILEAGSNDEGDEVTTTGISKAKGESRSAESESEMSEVLDEAPRPMKKAQKVTATFKKEKNPVKAKRKEDANIDPQEAEIKRLQSWLLKCGIRKMWYKELAPYSSPNAKINHLKSMLKDAGMDGRYSAEKAKQIKEERELKAELEAVQEGAKHWGEPAVTTDDGRRPTRRLAKGLREFDFLGDDDGEETD